MSKLSKIYGLKNESPMTPVKGNGWNKPGYLPGVTDPKSPLRPGQKRRPGQQTSKMGQTGALGQTTQEAAPVQTNEDHGAAMDAIGELSELVGRYTHSSMDNATLARDLVKWFRDNLKSIEQALGVTPESDGEEGGLDIDSVKPG